MVHMGTMIWKEMKRQEIPRADFAKMLKAQDIRISDLFKKEIVPALDLLKIGVILKTNFFTLYESHELGSLLPDETYDILRSKVEKLSELAANKTRIIKTQERLISQQRDIIASFETKNAG